MGSEMCIRDSDARSAVAPVVEVAAATEVGVVAGSSLAQPVRSRESPSTGAAIVKRWRRMEDIVGDAGPGRASISVAPDDGWTVGQAGTAEYRPRSSRTTVAAAVVGSWVKTSVADRSAMSAKNLAFSSTTSSG